MIDDDEETIAADWAAALGPALADPALVRLDASLRAAEARGAAIFPPRGMRLRALSLTPLETVRVVILGQDPYHGAGQATGLAFSTPDSIPLPPSLRNIFRELVDDIGCPMPGSGDLAPWARQGVLLLNTCLTVEEGRAASHSGQGWEALTDAVVQVIADSGEPCVFILWGSHAQAKAARIPGIRASRHLVIESPHPSPLSAYRGFLGSRPFSRANAFLEKNGRGTIDWCLAGQQQLSLRSL